MTVLLYTLGASSGARVGPLDDEVFANFETRDSIDGLVDHVRAYVPGFGSVCVDDPDWQSRLGRSPPLNYTFGFGLFEQSIRTTLTLEAGRIDYLGASLTGLYLSANKPHAARLLRSMGFRCPRDRIVAQYPTPDQIAALSRSFGTSPFLVVKPAYEESSIGLRCIANNEAELAATLSELWPAIPGPWLVQEYIDGIDVTVPMIGRARGICLPALQLRGPDLSDGPFVFAAALKASKSNLSYHSIGDYPADLRATIYAMAIAAFDATRQRDYARLDCRVTADGECYFLEMNANPQLALDKASFAVSSQCLGMELGEVIGMMIGDDAPSYGQAPEEIGL
jgi:D-alanine-D-alanine ligase